MIPSVNDATIYRWMGTLDERLAEKRAIRAVERAELGLPPTLSRQEAEARRSVQQQTMNRLAVPVRRVQRKTAQDHLDLRHLDRKRAGPLPVDEEVAEENEIIAKQLYKMRQTGMLHRRSPSGGADYSASLSLSSSTSALPPLGGDSADVTFMTGVVALPFSKQQHSSLSSPGTKRPGSAHNQQGIYAGDVLFRPGRLTSTLEPCEFWLYARQKVTQRTLGTTVLQHPVVVGITPAAIFPGGGGDAADNTTVGGTNNHNTASSGGIPIDSPESLKQLLKKSPIYESIKRKVAHLLTQTGTRTRCGILFDLLSTRNIIVSGVPNIVGNLIYEHIHEQIRLAPPEQGRSIKFVFVGITDNSNCTAARDVFNSYPVLNGRDVSATKRSFAALDNTHIFAVHAATPKNFETLLGPAVEKSGAVTRSSPLGMRPWHAAMEKKTHTLPDMLAPLVKREAQKLAAASGGENNNNNNNNNQDDDDVDYDEDDGAAANSWIPPSSDVRAVFDRRDWVFLPNVSGQQTDNVKRWQESEMHALRAVVTGPTVSLSKMTKRYNAEARMVKRLDLATVLSGVNVAPSALSRRSQTPNTTMMTMTSPRSSASPAASTAALRSKAGTPSVSRSRPMR